MFGKCKICIEKDARIEELKKNNEFLKRMLAPNALTPLIDFESNKLLEGGINEIHAPSIVTEDQAKELEEIEAEANRILTGNY